MEAYLAEKQAETVRETEQQMTITFTVAELLVKLAEYKPLAKVEELEVPKEVNSDRRSMKQ